MRVILIRHFATKGNIEKRYVGSTDEDILKAVNFNYEHCEMVFSSPLKRCIHTAEAIYKLPINIEENLRETNFGDFEYKNYDDLKNNEYYNKWIISEGSIPFPNGESVKEFCKRTVSAFYKCIETAKKRECKSVAFIVHGGSIMSILSHFLNMNFYNFHVKNGCGYICEYDSNKLKIIGEINV